MVAPVEVSGQKVNPDFVWSVGVLDAFHYMPIAFVHDDFPDFCNGRAIAAVSFKQERIATM